MTTPLITWGCMAALFLIVLIVRLFRAASFCSSGRHRMVEFGSEREEFFIPGDRSRYDRTTPDYDDFDDI